MMVAGLRPIPLSGEVVRGRQAEVARATAAAARSGHGLPELRGVPAVTVFDNVAFPLKIRKAPRLEILHRVAEALEMVRLTGYEHRLPRQLSGGEQQRVALARALVFRAARRS